MSYDPDVTIKAGTVLKNCRIIIPGGVSVIVDQIVRHSTTLTRKDGTLAVKTGVRLLQTPAEIKSLISVFIKDVDASYTLLAQH